MTAGVRWKGEETMKTQGWQTVTACFTILAGLCGGSTAYARLGETEEQANARYGAFSYHKYWQKDNLEIKWTVGNFEINAFLFPNENGTFVIGTMTISSVQKEDVQPMLDANSGGERWSSPETVQEFGGVEVKWTRNGASARYVPSIKSLELTSTAYTKWREEGMAKRKKEYEQDENEKRQKAIEKF